MAMEHECKKQCELFPIQKDWTRYVTLRRKYSRIRQFNGSINFDDFDLKMEESMENIEAVVRERNRAYYFLETGTSDERRD